MSKQTNDQPTKQMRDQITKQTNDQPTQSLLLRPQATFPRIDCVSGASTGATRIVGMAGTTGRYPYFESNFLASLAYDQAVMYLLAPMYLYFGQPAGEQVGQRGVCRPLAPVCVSSATHARRIAVRARPLSSPGFSARTR